MSRVTCEEMVLSRLAESTRAPWRYPSRMIRVESRTFYEEDPRVFRGSLGNAEGMDVLRIFPGSQDEPALPSSVPVS